MREPYTQTNEEKVLLEVVLNADGTSELECTFKHYIISPRTYISRFEERTGLKLWHNRTTSDNGKNYTRYQLPDPYTACKVIEWLNNKAWLRNEIAITPEQAQQILSRFNV
ncbi:Hemophilus-specific protein [Mannheimia varigena USDA-ARS-USMARC-1296]|uniref:Hemophilus-specific protein n=1 Tax=Mannheimia varigena USDA-ARS-USMARC-1296 TaxID=1433287 RepID=W0QBP5_9PAST|nr:hypothetical protein [Mannheimia varigena]AHG76314.1 Hemophilus-specific protein [Mannheimia varigena USDA-ARS-USMARC-1296]